MNVLVINAGSSSLKYQLLNVETHALLAKGICERVGSDDAFHKHGIDDNEVVIDVKMADHDEAMALVLEALTCGPDKAIDSLSEIDAIGHRIVQGGKYFDRSVIIDDEVVRICEKNAELGPLHMPGNIACIKSCREVMPGVPMVAVFDTTFHSTMPPKAFMYGIPYSVYQQYKIRKYGFHGTSHKFVSEEAVKYLGAEHSRIIICHLGNGSSISAVKDGKCIDTSMGFTPLEGLIMGTRSGDIDPAAVEFLREKLGMTPEETVQYLNKKCGMLGISELDSDMRVLEKAIADGNEKAALAVEAAAYRIKKYIGAFAAALGGVDAIVFTGGIGENSSYMRRLIMEDMEYLGVTFDFEENEKRAEGLHILSDSESYVKVIVLPTNEELSIARETAKLVAADRR